MNVNTGHLVDEACLDEIDINKDDYDAVPQHLNRAARRKLAGKKEAYVSLKSNGKLAKWAKGVRQNRKGRK